MKARRIYRVKVRRLLLALERLHAEGSALPSFTVSRTRVSYSPATRRLYVNVGNRRYASISRGGIVRPVTNLSKFDVAVIKTLVENPLDVARGAAILSGLEARCPVCGRVLDSKDRLQGIGPACYEKMEGWRLETTESNRVRKPTRRKKHGENRGNKRRVRGHEG